MDQMMEDWKKDCKSSPLELGEVSLDYPCGVPSCYDIYDESNKIIDGVIYANIYKKLLICYNKDDNQDIFRYKLIQNINFRILRKFPEIGFEPDNKKECLYALYQYFLIRKKN